MSDTQAPASDQQLTDDEIAAGKYGVPSFTDTLHKIIDRVLPQHTWEGRLAHESVRREFNEPEPEPVLTVVPPAPAAGAAFDYDALAAAMLRQQAAQQNVVNPSIVTASDDAPADYGNPGGGDAVPEAPPVS
jgi:hypothetical protein